MPPSGDKFRSENRAARVASLLIVIALAVGCTADLRPDEMRQSGIKESSEERGARLIERLPEAHGGLERWRNHGTARVVLRDWWPSWLMRTAAMPWFENGQLLELTTRLGSDDARIEFLEEPNEGLQWGIQNWATYTVDPDGELIFESDDTITFWVPTVTYFFEAPFRLHEADVVSWIGQEEADGTTYDKVFLSWGTAEPQDKIDQYVAWIDRETGRLGYLAYTVRDMMSNLEGFMKYTDYIEVDGIWVARTMAVVDSTESTDGLHRMDVESVEFGVERPTSFFYPDPSRTERKHDD